MCSEEETNQADLENQGLIIQMDGNCHVGNEVIKNDPNKQNNNGRHFAESLSRNPSLILVTNSTITMPPKIYKTAEEKKAAEAKRKRLARYRYLSI